MSTIEVRPGLNVGDRVILSDMSAYDHYDRIKLNRSLANSEKGNEEMDNIATVDRLEQVSKVFVTDEVETHALDGIHFEVKRRVSVDFRALRAAENRRCWPFSGLLDSPIRRNLLPERQTRDRI